MSTHTNPEPQPENLRAAVNSVLRRIIPFEVWLVAAAVAGAMLSQRLLPAAAVLAGVFWLLRRITGAPLTRRTPADWGVIALCALATLNAWITPFPEITRPQFWRLLGGVALYYALVNWLRSEQRLRWAVSFTLLSGLGLCAFALVGIRWAPKQLGQVSEAIIRVQNLFPARLADWANPNVVAGNIILFLPLAFALVTLGRKVAWEQLGLAWLFLLAGSGVVVLTLSRGAVAVFGLSVFLVVALRWRWGWMFSLLGVAAATLAAQTRGLADVLDLLLAGSSLGGLSGRVEVWTRAIYMIQDFPLTGVGMGAYQNVADLLYPFFSISLDKPMHAHNLFLQLAVDLGIPGLIAWTSVVACVLAASVTFLRRARRHADVYLAGVAAGLLGCLAAILVHGQIEAVVWGMVRPAPLTWALWGIIIAGFELIGQTQPGQVLARNSTPPISDVPSNRPA